MNSKLKIVSKIKELISRQMPAPQNGRKSNASDHRGEAQSLDDKVFEEFCADRETIAALGVTAEEFRELSRASLLGALTCKEDVLFMLRQVREAMKPKPPRAIERPIPDLNEVTETMRLAALAKLDESDLNIAARSRTAWHRVLTVLNRRNRSSPSYPTS
jgi:hypothetical protein